MHHTEAVHHTANYPHFFIGLAILIILAIVFVAFIVDWLEGEEIE